MHLNLVKSENGFFLGVDFLIEGKCLPLIAISEPAYYLLADLGFGVVEQRDDFFDCSEISSPADDLADRVRVSLTPESAERWFVNVNDIMHVGIIHQEKTILLRNIDYVIFKNINEMKRLIQNRDNDRVAGYRAAFLKGFRPTDEQKEEARTQAREEEARVRQEEKEQVNRSALKDSVFGQITET